MKWRALVLFLAAAIFTLGFGAAVPEQSLREAARGSGMLIGTAVRPAQLSEADYASTLAREFNMLEPEDALKWEVVHPEPQSFDFSQADQIVDFATRHNMKVRGHTLVWHRQNPKWLTEGKYTSGELAEILEKHIKTVVGHYRGKIFAWDVVNEAFDELRPGELRSTIWRDQPGIAIASSYELRATSNPGRSELAARSSTQSYSYIERCFRWAHEADPQALLFYNEAEAEVVIPSRTRSMPWFAISDSAASPSMAWDFRCTLRTCTPMSHPFPPTSNASRLWECRSTSPRWTSRCRSTPTAILAPRTCNGKRTSIARLPPLVCPIPAAGRFRHGVSPTSIPGSDRIRSRHRAQPYCLTRAIGPSRPARRCGMPWQKGVTSCCFVSSPVAISARTFARWVRQKRRNHSTNSTLCWPSRF